MTWVSPVSNLSTAVASALTFLSNSIAPSERFTQWKYSGVPSSISMLIISTFGWIAVTIPVTACTLCCAMPIALTNESPAASTQILIGAFIEVLLASYGLRGRLDSERMPATVQSTASPTTKEVMAATSSVCAVLSAGCEFLRPLRGPFNRLDQRHPQSALFQFQDAVDRAACRRGDSILEQRRVIAGLQHHARRAVRRLCCQQSGDVAR